MTFISKREYYHYTVNMEFVQETNAEVESKLLLRANTLPPFKDSICIPDYYFTVNKKLFRRRSYLRKILGYTGCNIRNMLRKFLNLEISFVMHYTKWE